MTNKSKKRNKNNNPKTTAKTEAKAASVPAVAPEGTGTDQPATPAPEAVTEAPSAPTESTAPVATETPTEAEPVAASGQLPLPGVPEPVAPATPEVPPDAPIPGKEKVNLTERIKGKKTTKIDRIAAKRNKRLRKFARFVKDGRGRLVLQLTGGKAGEPFLVRFKLPKGHLLRGKEGFVSRSPTYEVRGMMVTGRKGTFGLPMLFVIDG